MFQKMLISLMARSAWLTALALWLMARRDPEAQLALRAVIHDARKRQR